MGKSFFSEEYSDTLFNIFKSETEWAQNDIVIFGKKYKIPRLNEWYGSVDMNYSNINFEAKPLTKTLDQILKNIEKALKKTSAISRRHLSGKVHAFADIVTLILHTNSSVQYP